MPASPRLQALLRAKEENEIGNFLSAVLGSQEEVGGISADRYMEIMDRSPYGTGIPLSLGYDEDSIMSPLDMAAIVSSAIPIVGDVTGLAADADMYARDPESRNMINYLLSAAGAIPLIPAASQVAKLRKIYEDSPNDPVAERNYFEARKQRDSAEEVSEEKDLQFLHNTSSGKIARQQAMGGLPMPSLAVTRQDIPFEGFGDITLVGDPAKFDPKQNRANVVYDADAYTVRAPSPVKQAKKGAYKKLNEEFGDIAKKYDGYIDEAKYLLADLETKKDISSDKYSTVERFFENNLITDIAFLQEKGITDIPLRQYGTNKSADGRKISEMVSDFGQERKDWAKNKINQYFFSDELFVSNPDRDYYTTAAKLKPYTVDEATKFMKRKRGAGQESVIGTGVGMVRANLAKQLKSLPEIRSEKGRLVTAEDVSEFKSEMDSTLIDLQDIMQPFYQYDAGGFRYRDEVSEMIYDSDRIGLDRAFKKYGFENVDDDVKKSITDYKFRLRSGPTEYFEAKPGRAVDFSEFAGAIVPVSTPESTVNALKKAGLKIEYYQGESERLDARMKFPGTAFSIAGGIVLTRQLRENEADPTAEKDPSV